MITTGFKDFAFDSGARLPRGQVVSFGGGFQSENKNVPSDCKLFPRVPGRGEFVHRELNW